MMCEQRLCHLVVARLGVVSNRLEGFLKDLGILEVLGGMQASAVIEANLKSSRRCLVSTCKSQDWGQG